MTSKTVAALLSDLEVTRLHSRPRGSHDNHYSESLFKTLKYGPTFPERFAFLGDARAFMSGFVEWCNHHLQHSGIGFHTPANIHFGHAAAVAGERSEALVAAREKHMTRFATTCDPKILALQIAQLIRREVGQVGGNTTPCANSWSSWPASKKR